MHRYAVQKELRSRASFSVPLAVGDVEIVSSSGVEPRLIATTEIEAADFKAAFSELDRVVLHAIDLLALAHSVAISSYGTSVLLHRQGLPEALFLTMRPELDTVDIQADELDAAQLVNAAAELDTAPTRVRHAARHYRESLLYPSTLVVTIHLLRAAEAMHGQAVVGKHCRTCDAVLRCADCGEPATTASNDGLKEFLGSDYGFFYGSHGIRHQIMHGRALVDQDPLIRANDRLRGKVVGDLRASVGINPDAPFNV